MSTSMTPLRSPSMAPPRLSEGGGTDYERRLLGSARLDSLPSASVERVQSALRAASSGPLTHGAAASRDAVANATVSVVKRRVIGIVGTGIVGAGIMGWVVASQGPPRFEHSMTSSGPTVAAPNVAAPLAVRTPTPDPLPIVAATAESAQTPKASEANLGMPAPSRSRPKAAENGKTEVAREPVSPNRSPGLAEEIQAIESIQTLLAWGQAEQAYRALTAYRRDFSRGELLLEAELLEVDVALARGDRRAARQLAHTLLERPAASRYRARLGELLERADGSNPPAR